MKLDEGQCAISNPDNLDAAPKSFTFDAVYDETATQSGFYEESCFGLVESVLEGFNGTIFAYGQTGCGKTHTMQGRNSPPEDRGVIPHSFDHIFETITLNQEKGMEYLLRCCYLEIYNEEIRDLLVNDSKTKCELKEDPNKGIYVKGLTNVVVNDKQLFYDVMDKGQANRTVGATLMNAGSSRSHSIFTIYIEMGEKDDSGNDHFKLGKLNLVDLAGSERADKTGASGDRLKEGCKINLSLSALGNVISALVDGKGKHIPYRDSKLTRLLQDSLGGNTKTLMVAACSPADYNYDETLSTLRYANRAKNIKNKPTVNEDPKDAMLREYKMEIERLRKLLEEKEIQDVTSVVRSVPPAVTSQLLESAEESVRAMQILSARKPLEPDNDVEQKSSPVFSQSEPKKEILSARLLQSPIPSPERAGHLQTLKEDESAHFLGNSSQASLRASPDFNLVLPATDSNQEPIVISDTEDAVMLKMGMSVKRDSHETKADVRPMFPVTPKDSARAPKESPQRTTPRSPNLVESASKTSPCPKPVGVTVAVQADDLEIVVQPRQLDTVQPSLKGSKPYLQPAEPRPESVEPRVRVEKEIVVQYQDRVVEVEKVVEVERVVKEIVEVEKIPQKHIETQSALEDYNKAIVQQRNLLGSELQLAQEAAKKQREERQALAQKLLEMEAKLTAFSMSNNKSKGRTSKAAGTKESIDKILARERAEHRHAQLKAKAKKQKEARQAVELQQASADKEEVEMILSKAVEDKNENERRMQHLKKKMEQQVNKARQEIDDLTEEFERERENLTDMLRDANKEVKLWEQVAALFLSQREMRKVLERSVWIVEMEEWRLPTIKGARHLNSASKLPRLPNANGGISDISTPGNMSDASDRGLMKSTVRLGKTIAAKFASSDGTPKKTTKKQESHNDSGVPIDRRYSGDSMEALSQEEDYERQRKLRHKRKKQLRQAMQTSEQQPVTSTSAEILAEMARNMRGQSARAGKHGMNNLRKYEEAHWAEDYRNVLNDVDEFRIFRELEEDKKEIIDKPRSYSKQGTLRQKPPLSAASNRLMFERSEPVSVGKEPDPYMSYLTDGVIVNQKETRSSGNSRLPSADYADEGSLRGEAAGQQGRLPSRREGRSGRSQNQNQEPMLSAKPSKSSKKKNSDDGEVSQSVSLKLEANKEQSVNISFNVHIDRQPAKPHKEGRQRKHRSSNKKGSTKGGNDTESSYNAPGPPLKPSGSGADAGAGKSNYSQMLEMFWNGDDDVPKSNRNHSDVYDILEREFLA